MVSTVPTKYHSVCLIDKLPNVLDKYICDEYMDIMLIINSNIIIVISFWLYLYFFNMISPNIIMSFYSFFIYYGHRLIVDGVYI